MSFPGNSILLISPQAWSSLHISKHHYAVALANSGYEVYFLNPAASRPKAVTVSQPIAGTPLYVVDSGFFKSLFLRYKIGFIYDIIVSAWIRKLMKRLPSIGLVWCFDTNSIRNLSALGGMKKILHVVDPIDSRMISVSKETDLVVCVSHRILNQFRKLDVPKVFINHGLSEQALQQARSIDFPAYKLPGPVKAGYVGNLFRQVLNPGLVAKIVDQHPAIEFHFFGPYQTSDYGLGGEGLSLAAHLADKANVTFHGPVASNELIRRISGMDVFLLAYQSLPGFYDSSNSHKILEYLATGKVVVTTYIDQYAGPEFSEMLLMADEDNPEKLPQLFNRVVNDLITWNSLQRMEKRRRYALSNSYMNHVQRILGSIEWQKS